MKETLSELTFIVTLFGLDLKTKFKYTIKKKNLLEDNQIFMVTSENTLHFRHIYFM